MGSNDSRSRERTARAKRPKEGRLDGLKPSVVTFQAACTVEQIVRTALERAPAEADGGQVVPLPGRFVRAPQSFAHHTEPHEEG